MISKAITSRVRRYIHQEIMKLRIYLSWRQQSYPLGGLCIQFS